MQADLYLCTTTVLVYYYLFKANIYLTATGNNMASSAMSVCIYAMWSDFTGQFHSQFHWCMIGIL